MELHETVRSPGTGTYNHLMLPAPAVFLATHQVPKDPEGPERILAEAECRGPMAFLQALQ